MSEAGRVRVLLANDRLGYDDARFHGAGRLMVEWTRVLLQRGVSVTPVILRQPGSLGASVKAQGLPFAFLCRHAYDPGTLIDFLQIIRRDRIQVLHLQGFGSTFFGRIAARLLRLPVIVHVHADHRFEPKHYPPFVQAMDHALAGRTTQVLAISEAVAHFAIEQQGFHRDQIEVMHNPVDLRRFRPPDVDARAAGRNALGLGSDARVVICVARFDPVKGVDLLIEAWPDVVAVIPSATLLLVGDGPLHASLEQRARALGLSGSIRFLGYRSDVESILGLADLSVVPSRSEGLSLAAIESMASGLAVVAARVGGLPEVVRDGETGLLVEPENPPALAAAVTRVLGDAALRTSLAATARRFSLAYDLDAYCARLESLYRHLAGLDVSPPAHSAQALSGVS
jgi:glycosyltransferase involved in cell wall biosynthesis